MISSRLFHWFARLGTSTVAATLAISGWVSPVDPVRPSTVGRDYALAAVAGTGWAASVRTPLKGQMVGFAWEGTSRGVIEVRANNGRRWSSWSRVEGNPAEGPDRSSPEHRNRTTAGPIWIGGSTGRLDIRVVEGDLAHLHVQTIRAAQSSPGLLAPSPAAASPARPGLISRAQWGADESWRRFAPGCDGNPEYGPAVRFAVLHHSDTPNSYKPSQSAAMVRAIYWFHTHVNGWCDVGYNFVVDRFGQVFEGRAGGVERAVVGAHAGGFNRESTGVAMLGTFSTTGIPAPMYSAVRSLLSWKMALHGINPSGQVTTTAEGFDGSRFAPGPARVPAISGHRDLDSTDCPGELGYELLAHLRSDVTSDVGSAGGSNPGRPCPSTLNIPLVDALLCPLKPTGRQPGT